MKTKYLLNSLLVFILTVPFYCFSQNNDKLVFSNAYLKYVVLDANNNVVTEIPRGKDVSIVYDKYFKSYYITYTTDNNTLYYFDLKFIKNNEDGTMLYNDAIENTNYTLIDDLFQVKSSTLLFLGKMSAKDDKNHYLYEIYMRN